MIELKNQELCVSGKIGFENAGTIYSQGLALIQHQNVFPITVNLAQLEHGNTLALAVLVQWLRQTPKSKGLHLTNVPEKMMKIIQSCHLQDDLNIS